MDGDTPPPGYPGSTVQSRPPPLTDSLTPFTDPFPAGPLVFLHWTLPARRPR